MKRRGCPLRIAIITNPAKTNLAKYDPNSRLQAEATCKAVSTALSNLGHEVQVIKVGPRLLLELETIRPDALFNISTGYHTKKGQANVAAMLELSGIPFTGSDSRAHMTGLLKHISKMNFKAHGVLTPKFIALNSVQELTKCPLEKSLSFPVIVKPAAEGSSVGIFSDSVTCDPAEVKCLVTKLLDTLEPPVLVEEFISGREFTVALAGYPEPMVLPVEEIIFNEKDIYTYGIKIRDNVTTVCPAQISKKLTQAIQDTAKKAFKATGCRDIARVDIRVSSDERPFVLEINTLPGLMPDYSEVPRIAEKAGISYTELIEIILQGPIKRKTEAANSSTGNAAGF